MLLNLTEPQIHRLVVLCVHVHARDSQGKKIKKVNRDDMMREGRGGGW